MQVNFQTVNSNNNFRNAKATSFQGVPPVRSKLFDPVTKQYDNLTEFIANKYYAAIYKSPFAKWFIDKTKSVKNMTTHMSAIGATLISGMYTVRTLQNDKLDSEKRKTLALNDVMTWGLSTAGSYFIDNKLASWWDRVTNRFTANYLLDNPRAKRLRTLGDWNPAHLQEMMGKKFSMDADASNIDNVIAEAKKNGFQVSGVEDGKINFTLPGKFNKLISERIDRINKAIEDPNYKGLRKPLQHVDMDPVISNIRDFNLDVLKNKRLTTLIDGFSVLKSLFVFGMVYRYIVPVMVMKPANKLGAYIHKKNAEKAQTQTQEAKKA